MILDRITSGSTATAASSTATVSRRAVLKMGIAGGGLLLGVSLPGLYEGAAAAHSGEFVPNAFIRITSDGTVILTMPYVEMGQGTYTSIPMLIAEELEVALTQIRLEHAPPDEKRYGNPLIGGVQATGGSTAIRAAWDPMRQAGATAREMLITAAARHWQVDRATCRAEHGKIVHVLSGRSLTYGELVDEAAQTPLTDQVVLKRPDQFTLIGTPAKRLDTPRKVNGATVYGIDVRPPGAKIATLAQCPVFGGRLKRLDDSDAKVVRGVRQIVALDDAVAVVADHMGAARKALAVLKIEWDEGPHATLVTEDIARELEQGTLHPGAVAENIGDTAGALPTAAKRVDATYHVPFLAHAAMEPMNCTVHVQKDRCEVWVGTQVCARAQAAAAQVTGLPLEQIVVHNHYLGGGFGRRLEIDGVRRAVQIATYVEGPVKVIWTREEDIQHDMYRPFWFDRFTGGLDAAGRPLLWHHRYAGSSVISRFLPPGFSDGLDPDSTDGAIHLAYDLPNRRVEYLRAEPPGIPTAFWRGVGPSHTVFAVESFMDELATAAKQDPVAYRRALLDRAPRARAVLDLAAEKAGWGRPIAMRSGRGVALQNVFGTYMAQVVEVEVAKTGEVRVRRVVCALDCGVAVNPDTIEAQVQGAVIFGISAALWGRITLKDGRVEQSNFDDYRVLRMNEAPVIETHIIRSIEKPGGIGEPGTCCVMPAIANAIFSATGERLRHLPVDPRLLRQV